MQESKKLVQESISGGKIWNRKSMPVKEKLIIWALELGQKKLNSFSIKSATGFKMTYQFATIKVEITEPKPL